MLALRGQQRDIFFRDLLIIHSGFGPDRFTHFLWLYYKHSGKHAICPVPVKQLWQYLISQPKVPGLFRWHFSTQTIYNRLISWCTSTHKDNVFFRRAFCVYIYIYTYTYIVLCACVSASVRACVCVRVWLEGFLVLLIVYGSIKLAKVPKLIMYPWLPSDTFLYLYV